MACEGTSIFRLRPEIWARSNQGGIMSRVVVLGAGITGHTAASFAKRWLGRGDTVTVVTY
jgi:D-arabinose 5-phosphate isomerase GutQ